MLQSERYKLSLPRPKHAPAVRDDLWHPQYIIQEFFLTTIFTYRMPRISTKKYRC